MRRYQIAYRQVNAAASSVLPVPLYRAVNGYAQRMRSYHLRAAEFARDDARWCLACSTQRRMMPA
jgi:hypothetical protein